MSKPQDNPSSFRLGPDLDQEVTRMSEALEISRTQLVKKAVKHFIARQKHIDAVLSEARASYAAYKATGRAVPWQEASGWLRNGGGKENRPVLKDVRK